MKEIKKILQKNIIMVSFGKKKNRVSGKLRVRKIISDGREYFQAERILDNKAYHENLEKADLSGYVEKVLSEEFMNSVIYTDEADYYINISKKNKITIIRRKATKKPSEYTVHNIKKNYIIPEGKACPFLIELGIMDKTGKVNPKSYSKFRQINRFLEIIDNEFHILNKLNKIVITDMCCGKGYLTLALHHYFTKIKSKEVNIKGIDLKKDVIKDLNSIIGKLNLLGIEFVYGDIEEIELNKPNIVVALHACDTATDTALAKAVESEAEVVLAVPCCQHEIFSMIKNESLKPILKYGIMKDKMTELVTNSLRGLALEAAGYKVRMIEFTSLEHTMKNIMIKAIRTNKKDNDALKKFYEMCKIFNVKSSAEKIINHM